MHAFWDSIDFDNNEVDIKFDNLMSIVDFDNRWIYKGSRTMPPCGRYVYWNVINKVYPIKPEIMEKMKVQLEVVNSAGHEVRKNQRAI